MKKILFSLLAVLFMVGIANADVGGSSEPKLYPVVWTVTAYNGSGDNIVSGVAVRWDINASTTDMAGWIEQVDAIAEVRTAGAIPYGKDCANGTNCQIIVYGPTIMYDNGNTTTDATLQEADANGYPVDETLSAADEAALGWCVEDDASAVANTNLAASYAVIFINPTPYSGD